MALKFRFLWFARSFHRSFVRLLLCFALVLLLPFVVVIVTVDSVAYCSFRLRLSLFGCELMKNLLRSFIHFRMNYSYQIKHLAWRIIASADARNPFYVRIVYSLMLRRSTNYPPLYRTIRCIWLCLLVCWLIWLDGDGGSGGGVTTKMHFLNVIETLLTGWLTDWIAPPVWNIYLAWWLRILNLQCCVSVCSEAFYFVLSNHGIRKLCADTLV